MPSKSKPYVGEVAKIGHGNRIGLPKSVLEAAGWTDPDGPTKLVAEFIDSGHVRLHLPQRVRAQLEEILRNLEEGTDSDPEAVEKLAAFHDRYTEVVYYPEGHRVRLTTEVYSVLGAHLSVNRVCLVQAVNGSIDLLSEHQRTARQLKYRREIGLE